MTANRSAKLFGEDKPTRPAAPETIPNALPSPSRGVTLVLRLLSLAVGYGTMRLSMWALQNDASSHRTSLVVLGVAAGSLCIVLVWLGTLASPKVVGKVWKAIGKVILGLLMFT
ncbi:MAG: hypothetical protein HN742_16930 [Lentisphaerae bacterium]|nr:hypothetical protein [Lentisphaerota bacterium]MBT4823132.1 hypothetical protein [Lentisphaerota bacterium]MBT5610480.1 hypothetical protein [Lentisphaerota bacterium]MBT7061071.1 hypothetical protein [Lentisphaerota bacterium]MBT7843566.1 hypothetical protein [Lentisphaerota bacterium]